MKQKVVAIFGAPGSGKGTQANLLAWKQGFIHFDSGKYLRGVLHDPANQNKKIVQRERKLNDSGLLNTPSWVLGLFKKEAERIHDAGMSIVYSGSPRTVYEAFGDLPRHGSGKAGKKNIGLVPYLAQLYGRKNLIFISLMISPEAGIRRNQKRRICVVCGTGVLANSPVERCPICEGELKVRVDDRPEAASTRIKEFETRTKPIFDELEKRKFEVHEVDATPAPYLVYEQIAKLIP